MRIFFILILLLSACQPQSGWKVLAPDDAFRLVEKRRLQLPDSMQIEDLIQMGYGQDTSGIFIYVLNQRDSAYYTISEKRQHRIKVNGLVNQESYDLRRFTPIFIDMEQVLLLNRAGDVVSLASDSAYSSIDLDRKFDDTLSFHHVVSHTVIPASSQGLHFVVRAYPMKVDNEKALHVYFQNPVASIIDFDNKTMRPIGEFPHQYQTGKITIPDFYPQLTYNSVDSVLSIGFKYNSQLFQYKIRPDGSYVKQNNVELETPQSFAFPSNIVIGDPNETRKFQMSSPAFLNIVYCEVNHVYYRSFLHEKELNDSHDQVKEQERPWSLIVYDRNLNPLKRIEMSETSFYPYRLFLQNGNLCFSTWQKEDELTGRVFVEVHELNLFN